jgi:guanylate kinase
MASRGKFILVIGPTGSGKSVLLSEARERFPELMYAITYTTREKRPGYENAAYRFLTVDEFQTKIDAGEFLEYAQFGGNFYGTPKTEVLDAMSEGKTLIKEMEVQGIRQVQQKMIDDLVLIYIDAGSWDELERRVRARAPITEEELLQRKQRYDDELPFRDIADFVIENPVGKLEEAKTALCNAIASVIASTSDESTRA